MRAKKQVKRLTTKYVELILGRTVCGQESMIRKKKSQHVLVRKVLLGTQPETHV